MRLREIRPYEPSFGIYKGHTKTCYGERTWGVYKDKKIEVYNAFKDNAKLIHVSDINTGKGLSFKFTYLQNGIKRVIKNTARYLWI